MLSSLNTTTEDQGNSKNYYEWERDIWVKGIERKRIEMVWICTENSRKFMTKIL